MNFLKKLFQPVLNVEVKIETSGGLFETDFSDCALSATELKEIASEYGIREYDSEQVRNHSLEAFQRVNLGRYADTPSNVVSNFNAIKFNLRSLSVYRSLSPMQYRVDIQTASETFGKNLPKNRIAKREVGYVMDSDKFVHEFDLNLEIAIHHELERIFNNLSVIEDLSQRKVWSKEWLSYYKNHWEVLERQMEGFQGGYNDEAKGWFTNLIEWAKYRSKNV